MLWVFDRAEGFDLVARVPLDEEVPHGVFASRSPRRPNPIGLTVVELLGRDGPRLQVRGLDMLDGTPILDIKPYLSSVAPEALRRGWVAEAEERRRKRVSALRRRDAPRALPAGSAALSQSACGGRFLTNHSQTISR